MKHPGEGDGDADKVFLGMLWNRLSYSNLCDQQQEVNIGKCFTSPDQTK